MKSFNEFLCESGSTDPFISVANKIVAMRLEVMKDTVKDTKGNDKSNLESSIKKYEEALSTFDKSVCVEALTWLREYIQDL